MLTDTLVFLSTGAEAGGNEILSAVPVENLTPETQEAPGGAFEPMEMAAGGAAAKPWRRGSCHATRTRSGGGRSFPGDPRRGAHPLCTDDRSRHE
jgi:hypothetical protein